MMRASLATIADVSGWATSGTPIACWDTAHYEWTNGRGVFYDSAYIGSCWDYALPTIQGRNDLNALVWWQGEADEFQSTDYYAPKMADLMSRFRVATGIPDLLVVVVQLAPYYASTPAQIASLAWAQQDHHAIVVLTNDLPFADGTHMSLDYHLATPAEPYLTVCRRIDQQVRAKLFR